MLCTSAQGAESTCTHSWKALLIGMPPHPCLCWLLSFHQSQTPECNIYAAPWCAWITLLQYRMHQDWCIIPFSLPLPGEELQRDSWGTFMPRRKMEALSRSSGSSCVLQVHYGRVMLQITFFRGPRKLRTCIFQRLSVSTHNLSPMKWILFPCLF